MKRWNPVRGFGFIQPDAAGADDLFVYASVLRANGVDSLEVGDRLEYRRGLGARGWQAEDVRVLAYAERDSGAR